MEPKSKLYEIANQADKVASYVPTKELKSLEKSSVQAGKAWSGSSLGYHSRVYYKDLQPVPPGARFSKEWGLKETFSFQETTGDWYEYEFDYLVELILQEAEVSSLETLEDRAKEVVEKFDDLRSEALSVLASITPSYESDTFFSDLVAKVEELENHSYAAFMRTFLPKGQQMTRDMVAAQAGNQLPPHYHVLAHVGHVKHAYQTCASLGKYIRRIASHIENTMQKKEESDRIGTNVFIGHGRSHAWRDLKDFIHERLHLPYDEFNRVPVAGFTNIARLSDMMDSAAIAFLVMTAEDEQVDGKWHARMNVIHEAGLFQGRLGFEKAILVLEEGCEEFSNVQGLGQIRFPNGNIGAAFEEIRRVLEREGIIEE